ncbi:hypothetical protein ACFPT7_14640 [Acidicapsa dinghuensis]|uniref:DUF239 domain-containing protein n=1 Tax=Acidicapsa dinghuensis TaxID=2218256 RepID=A0ABW1EGY1_9BACT|nr:hypothetical protein [Acidicapsa dinghuensis]
MFRNSVLKCFTQSIALTAFAASLTAAQAQRPAGQMRPATVPAEYVITPYGYFHPSCVQHLNKGDEVRKNENAIRHADGTYSDIQSCSFAHFDAKGQKVSEEASATKEPTISHAWVEYAGTTTSSSFGELVAEWTVPPAPSANNGQTVYLFPGLEDYADVKTILQPVLGWNSDYVSAWGIASWNCCWSGTVFEATPQKVAAGDTILGEMWDTCSAGTLSCATWDILTYDLTSGKYSEMLNTSSQGQTFNWAFAGALEVYNIAQCANYPPNGSISFHNIALYNDSFSQVVDPAWSVTNSSSGLTPQCGYGGGLSQQANLYY